MQPERHALEKSIYYPALCRFVPGTESSAIGRPSRSMATKAKVDLATFSTLPLRHRFAQIAGPTRMVDCGKEATPGSRRPMCEF
jgi:hypothetical protein